MAVGFPALKTDCDARSGQIVVRLREVFRDVQAFNTWLAGKQDADLTALGYSAADVTLLRASFADLIKLRNVAYGGVGTTVQDFFANAGNLTGVL